jgi:hypothetical protein
MAGLVVSDGTLGVRFERSRLGKPYRSFWLSRPSDTVEGGAGLAIQCDSRPTVLRIASYRFFFVFFDRGEPLHIHVRRESMVAKFWLDPVALQQAGGFNRSELNTIGRLVQEHRETILEGWYEFFGR